jgi:enamine deaminase RidA (YjgF/YER057c/UK114 family)
MVEKRLETLGISLAPQKNNCTVQCRRWKDLLFIGGTLSKTTGKAGELSKEELQNAGKEIAAAVLGAIKNEVGSLERVECFVRCLGYINSAGDFSDLPATMNGFSDVLTAAFGTIGKHTRAAVGVCELQGGAAMTVNVIVQLKEGS